jgi:hypothetical protein
MYAIKYIASISDVLSRIYFYLTSLHLEQGSEHCDMDCTGQESIYNGKMKYRRKDIPLLLKNNQKLI